MARHGTFAALVPACRPGRATGSFSSGPRAHSRARGLPSDALTSLFKSSLSSRLSMARAPDGRLYQLLFFPPQESLWEYSDFSVKTVSRIFFQVFKKVQGPYVQVVAEEPGLKAAPSHGLLPVAGVPRHALLPGKKAHEAELHADVVGEYLPVFVQYDPALLVELPRVP